MALLGRIAAAPTFARRRRRPFSNACLTQIVGEKSLKFGAISAERSSNCDLGFTKLYRGTRNAAGRRRYARQRRPRAQRVPARRPVLAVGASASLHQRQISRNERLCAARSKQGRARPDQTWPVNSSITCRVCPRPIRATGRSWRTSTCRSIPTPRSACSASTAPANRRCCASWPGSTTNSPARPGRPRAPASATCRRSRSSMRQNRCARTSWRAWRRRRRSSTATTSSPPIIPTRPPTR